MIWHQTSTKIIDGLHGIMVDLGINELITMPLPRWRDKSQYDFDAFLGISGWFEWPAVAATLNPVSSRGVTLRDETWPCGRK